MRVVIQRVSQAGVDVEGRNIANIGLGYLILVGIEAEDTNEDADWLANKIVGLRIFPDDAGLMNLNIQDVQGNILLVSQFTLHAKTKKGNRPSFIQAARPEQAVPLLDRLQDQLESTLGRQVFTGEFGAMMDVSLVNDGPVTIIVDTKKKE